MVERHGSFVWYELMTTDMAAAATFYAYLVGWGAQDASTPNLAYTLFTAGSISVGGLMGLPEDARKMGATPRWMGYVGVNDVDAAADRIKRLGGAVYVPPTNLAEVFSQDLHNVRRLECYRHSHRPGPSGRAGQVPARRPCPCIPRPARISGGSQAQRDRGQLVEAGDSGSPLL